jgi:hypothetical protein
MMQLRYGVSALAIALCTLVVISTVTAFAPTGIMPLRSPAFGELDRFQSGDAYILYHHKELYL